TLDQLFRSLRLRRSEPDGLGQLMQSVRDQLLGQILALARLWRDKLRHVGADHAPGQVLRQEAILIGSDSGQEDASGTANYKRWWRSKYPSSLDLRVIGRDVG